jgi:hypothetical protein
MFNVNQLNSKVANKHEPMSCNDAVPSALTTAVQSTLNSLNIDQFRLIQTDDIGGCHRLCAYVRIRLTPAPCNTLLHRTDPSLIQSVT